LDRLKTLPDIPNLPTNTSFSTILPNLQIAWDSVSRGAFKTCPRFYQYVIINGYTSRLENIHFFFGIGFHSALELYDRKRAEGKTHKQSLFDAIRFIISYTYDFNRKRPWLSDEPTKNRETLIRAIIWYLIQFEDDPLETMILSDKSPAVELSFHYPSGIVTSTTKEEILFTGHLDRVVNWNDKPWIVDRKTTKLSLTQKGNEKFFQKFSPDDQMSGYYFGGTIIFDQPIGGIIIDAGQTAATFTKFQRGFTNRSRSQLYEWYIDITYMIKSAETYAQNNYYPMNDKSCDKFGGCPFRPVCSEPPEMREELLEKFYTRRIWDPLITREV
jgi:hypothetical protein